MISFSNCQKININKLNHDVDQFRTRQKDYIDDELFVTKDDKYIILCHTITEGSMNAYYSQVVIFENGENQLILMNLNKNWTPLWEENFKYLPSTEEIALSITCFDAEIKTNPLPILLLDLRKITYTVLPKEYKNLDSINKNRSMIKWSKFDDERDFCKDFKDDNLEENTKLKRN